MVANKQKDQITRMIKTQLQSAKDRAATWGLELKTRGGEYTLTNVEKTGAFDVGCWRMTTHNLDTIDTILLAFESVGSLYGHWRTRGNKYPIFFQPIQHEVSPWNRIMQNVEKVKAIIADIEEYRKTLATEMVLKVEVSEDGGETKKVVYQKGLTV